MSKTALVDALKHFDLDQVRAILKKRPELKDLRLDKGVNILQFSCGRFTGDDGWRQPPVASREMAGRRGLRSATELHHRTRRRWRSGVSECVARVVFRCHGAKHSAR